MASIRVLWLIPVLALVACHDGKKDETAELGGRLQGGTVQGVEWRTPTRSGTTDASGRYAYLPGETVTFSIGSVELGAVPGSPDINLFTLAGMTPPTTELSLRRQLDLAMRTHTPFTRALNLELLLITLDADGDPDNGLDVRNRKAPMTGVSLDLDLPLEAFAIRLFRTVPDLVRYIPRATPVVRLFSSLDLKVPVHAPRRIETDSPMSPLVGVEAFDYLPDGALSRDASDYDGDGSFEYVSNFEYDGFGRQTRYESEQDSDGDGNIDGRYTFSQSFDARGKITGWVQRSSDDYFGQNQSATLVEYVLDDYGRTVRQVIDIDAADDGTVDERRSVTAVYEGTRTTYTSESDFGADGSVESRTVEIYDEDSRGRLVSAITETDAPLDGVIDSRHTMSVAWDDVARTSHQIDDYDMDADGIVETRYVYDRRRDRDDNVIVDSETNYTSGLGMPTWQQTTTRQFDGARRVTASVRDVDDDGNGVVDSRQSDSTTYDGVGNTTWYASDFDVGVDGSIDASNTEGSEYGASGELLASASHYDLNGDGFTDVRRGTTVRYDVVADGVRLLTDWYFRNRYSAVQ